VLKFCASPVVFITSLCCSNFASDVKHDMTLSCRVRMGLHSGVALSTDMTFNRTTQSMAYSGYPMKVAKIVGDSAAGGMVLLSSTTFTQLAAQLGALPGSPLPVYMGDADLGLDAASGLGGPMPLFALVVPELRPRFAHQEALRGITITQVTQCKWGHTRKWDRTASLYALLHVFFRKQCFGWALDDAWLRLRGSFMCTDRHLAGPRAVICSRNRRCEAKGTVLAQCGFSFHSLFICSFVCFCSWATLMHHWAAWRSCLSMWWAPAPSSRSWATWPRRRCKNSRSIMQPPLRRLLFEALLLSLWCQIFYCFTGGGLFSVGSKTTGYGCPAVLCERRVHHRVDRRLVLSSLCGLSHSSCLVMWLSGGHASAQLV
jgi:hypothetical protein